MYYNNIYGFKYVTATTTNGPSNSLHAGVGPSGRGRQGEHRSGPRGVRRQAGGAGDVPAVRGRRREDADARLLHGAQASGGDEQEVPLRPPQGPQRPQPRHQDQLLPRLGAPQCLPCPN